MSFTVLTNGEGGYGIKETVRALRGGSSLIDALELGIQAVEDDPRSRSVGYGGAPNILGEMELDASIMEGSSLRTGAVGALVGFRHPISVARGIMEKLPHVMLVGAGAARFAHEIGCEKRNMLSPESKSALEIWLENKFGTPHPPSDHIPLASQVWPPSKENISKGTTTFIIRSSEGDMIGGVSTSGWAYKYPGRLGDSPVIGAGLYVDNRYGGAMCTHTGEMTIRAGTARSVVLYMKKGATLWEALHEAREDLRALSGGFIGAVVIHAVDRFGDHGVVSTGNDGNVSYWVWRENKSEVEELSPTKIL